MKALGALEKDRADNNASHNLTAGRKPPACSRHYKLTIYFKKCACLPLQCLERCRAELCSVLGLQPSQLELSMGMSGDFEQAVSAVLPRCSRA